jgi:crotonobetainyl-CoA:carnitine CoA-transferase CaiB-like acyl-CoA transferase
VDFWTIQHTAEDVMGLLQAAGVAAGVVQTGADLSRDPQLKERGFFRRVLDHQGEYRTIESAPYKLSRTPGSVTKGAPAFGADLTYVLSEVLGMSDDELADCAIAGVFD